MMAVFEFRFLVCSYLPGLPLLFAIFLWTGLLEQDGYLMRNTGVLTFLFIVLPIIVGLLLDALRHAFGMLFGYLKNKCVCCRCLPVWRRLERPILGPFPAMNEYLLGNLLAKAESDFHVYEFFWNTGLSCFIALPLIWNRRVEGIEFSFQGPFAIVGACCIMFAFVWWLQQERLIRDNFR